MWKSFSFEIKAVSKHLPRDTNKANFRKFYNNILWFLSNVTKMQDKPFTLKKYSSRI